jgi:hypothetical protein
MQPSPPLPPDPRTAGRQNWRSLAFLHWRVDARELQPLVPRGLTLEEHSGSAWLGVVPFAMERVRPWWAPPVPGVSWFRETNVRTYVVDANGRAGVWFFSLDASKRLAVAIARRFWSLPYWFAHLELAASGDPAHPTAITYRGGRRGPPSASYDIAIELARAPARPAEPDTLDHFLVERYLLFTQRRDCSLATGRVHHEPYPLIDVTRCSSSQSLTAAMGIPIPSTRAPDHVAWSPGVDVRVSPLRSDVPA